MGRHESHLEEHSTQWGHQKQNYYKNCFVNRRVGLWNDKEIATTLTVPGTIRTAVARKIWSKIPGKTCVKKLINKCGCLKHCALFNRKPMQFLKHRSYTGVSTGTMLAVLFWMHCNLRRLNLERLLKSELQ